MFKNILLAVHGDENREFLERVLELCNFFKAEITVLHVAETGLSHYGYVDQLASAITKDQFIDYIYNMAKERQDNIYNEFKDRAEATGLTFQWRLREGKPQLEIVEEFKKGKYDLLILGTKPKSPGNTSSKVKERVLKEIASSVFIIK
ncbi:universal stress protein [Desulfotomaculum sp. 1211_IL3151]|uniref:universal stress protein n=1 Tax=Desulfotomaculum sp. 1211_IL3151 TaxID=3084055 RepID=UPI002FDABFFF